MPRSNALSHYLRFNSLRAWVLLGGIILLCIAAWIAGLLGYGDGLEAEEQRKQEQRWQRKAVERLTTNPNFVEDEPDAELVFRGSSVERANPGGIDNDIAVVVHATVENRGMGDPVTAWLRASAVREDRSVLATAVVAIGTLKDRERRRVTTPILRIKFDEVDQFVSYVLKIEREEPEAPPAKAEPAAGD